MKMALVPGDMSSNKSNSNNTGSGSSNSRNRQSEHKAQAQGACKAHMKIAPAPGKLQHQQQTAEAALSLKPHEHSQVDHVKFQQHSLWPLTIPLGLASCSESHTGTMSRSGSGDRQQLNSGKRSGRRSSTDCNMALISRVLCERLHTS